MRIAMRLLIALQDLDDQIKWSRQDDHSLVVKGGQDRPPCRIDLLDLRSELESSIGQMIKRIDKALGSRGMKEIDEAEFKEFIRKLYFRLGA